MKTKYTLFDGKEALRTSDNLEGCRLSALFHVQNGDQVAWHTVKDEPVQVAVEYGFVNGAKRFRISQL